MNCLQICAEFEENNRSACNSVQERCKINQKIELMKVNQMLNFALFNLMELSAILKKTTLSVSA